MSKKKHQARESLRDAAIALSDEIWAGKWQHIPNLSCTPVSEWAEILLELEKRAPGHTRKAYEDALFRNHMLRR
jgi:hypothetical protein